MKKRYIPCICILDNNKERCLREEAALDQAIANKNLKATGISNFGENHLARSGVRKFPAIEVDGVYFTSKQDVNEYTYELMCDFLDMLVRRGIIE